MKVSGVSFAPFGMAALRAAQGKQVSGAQEWIVGNLMLDTGFWMLDDE